MSFLFKSSKKGSTPIPQGLPPASRQIRSSDGPSDSQHQQQQSQIPTINGVVNGHSSSKPGSPTPHQQGSVNNSLNSVATEGARSSSAPPDRQQEDARQYMRGPGPNGPLPDALNGMGMRGSGPPSPEQKSLRERELMHTQPRSALTSPRPQGPTQPSDPSPYPWSQRRLTFTVSHTNPFPRYGAAVNATGSKDGSIYLMGGLINGSTVKGDLWMVEAGNGAPTGQGMGTLTCYPVATTSEGPGPRVGHASLLVGNAFIVFGGDTKMDEGDQLDDTLYLLNTSTKQWSRALPAGPRPPGRYGHTLNILGSRIYIFGGQVEGYFFNDLVAFDLNALQQATNRWEILISNTIDGGPPHGQIPPARTNHTVVSWGERLYLFGGTDGVRWFNDVWSYDPRVNSWTQLEGIGYIPSPREGHAAALVGDVMYIFGGRTEEGNDLGDLAAFRISSRRWYTFQNMGPSPSPRSGHSMTTVGKSIVVLAGEPSSAPRDPVELGLAYFLDTGKIRYPPDSASQTPVDQRIQGTRRPSGEKSGAIGGPAPGQAVRQGPPQQSLIQQAPVELMERQRMGSGDSFGLPGAPGKQPGRSESASRLPRAAPSPAPTGPPPQAPGQGQQPRTNGVVNARQPTRPPDRAFSPANEAERALRFENNNIMHGPQNGRDSPASTMRGTESRMPLSPSFAPPETPYYDAEQDPISAAQSQQQPQSQQLQQPLQSQVMQARRYQKPETYQPSQDLQSAADPNGAGTRALSRNQSTRSRTRQEDMDRIIDSDTPRQSMSELPESMPKVRQLREEEAADGPLPPQDSGIGSSPALSQQYEDLSKELEGAKAKNAWFATELALARKSGYHARNASAADRDSPVLDERGLPADVFADDDRVLVEALLKMRAELGRVQETIEQQARQAAERIAEMERQRDSAIQEAVFAKARLAGAAGDGGGNGSRGTPDAERSQELQRKLTTSLGAHGVLKRRLEALEREVEGERTARGLAEETAEAAQKRVQELEAVRTEQTSVLEALRTELSEVQGQHRDLSASHAEVSAQQQMLGVDKRELSGQLERLRAESEDHTGILATLREAVSASTQKAEVLEKKLEEERGGRDDVEGKLRQLRSEHEARTAELEGTQRRLRDAEELAERHAAEAKTHRDAVLAGLGKVADRPVDPASAADERVGILQQQVEEAKTMVRRNQAAADSAAQKLRSAEERIAGLEAYQEQASREGLGIRKQLQAAMKDKQGLESEKGDLEQRLQGQMLETNALAVQHSSLKDILGERGINPSEVRRSRALDSPSSLSRFSTPDLHRVRELEQQLEASLKSHDEMKAQFEEVSERDEKMKREYEEKLTALDNDHQAAVKYLRGTEKMLSKMKQELQRVKNENGELRKKTEKMREGGGGQEEEWEQERERLRKEVEGAQAQLKSSVSGLEGRIEEMQARLASTEQQLEQTRTQHATSQADFTTLQATHSQTRDDVAQLQKENALLEERARDAENKVQLLLDQVEHSVDNYRRQSRMSEATPTMMNGTSGFHQRNLSGGSEATTAAGNHIGGPMGGMGGGGGHSRNVSDAGESTYSQDTPTSAGGSGEDGGRNSMALDSLASELDALRSHWETTNKNYRLSGGNNNNNDDDGNLGGEKFDFPKRKSSIPSPGHLNGGSAMGFPPPGGIGMGAGGEGGGTLVNWRKGLELEGDEGSEGASRPMTSDGGTVRGEGSGDEHVHAEEV